MSGARDERPRGAGVQHDARRPAAGPAQIDAMISLLSDESEAIVARCRQALVDAGEAARPRLREALSRATGDSHRLIRRILADLAGDAVERDILAHFAARPELEAGSILIGRLVDGGTDPDAVSSVLDDLAARVDRLLGGRRDADVSLSALRRVLVDEQGLQGVPFQHARLLDALLHGVTAHRRGLPLPLCIAWILVGRRLGLPILGVGMPGHMLVRFDRPDGLAVIDPFHGGQASDETFWRQYLTLQGFPSADLTALDASDADMLVRTLRNLLALSGRPGEEALRARCTRILRQVVREG